MVSGYAHPLYAASLAEFGTPRSLSASGGWLLRRAIAGADFHDATGCYPLFACPLWSGLRQDLEDLVADCVSVALVADPFAPIPPSELRELFDRVTEFKQHFVVDLRSNPSATISKHHRYYARKALDEVEVRRSEDPPALADEWAQLYGHLVERHSLRGIKAFSRAAFDVQLRVPGLVMLRAMLDGGGVGAHLWYVAGEVAYSHLMALGPQGYQRGAAYALYWEAVANAAQHFGPAVRWLDLGSGAGVGQADEGLSRFKRGWANQQRPVYFCGRIFNADAYERLVRSRGIGQSDYFPAYREGEFS